MEKLTVFYGDVVRDDISGVNVSNCESMIVVVKDMVNKSFADVRKCIRVNFGHVMRGMKMTVEAFICVGGNYGEVARWGLREVKNENHWQKYMTFASTPDSAMFGEPMVYVQFTSASDEAGCSSSAAEVDVVPSAIIDPGYWSARVDLSEHVHGLQEALDHDDDGHSSSSSSSDEDGDGPPHRALAAPMDPKFLETLTISNEFRSVPGLGEASLMVGQSFPDKDSADQAIKRYAISISRQHRVKQSDRSQLKVICINIADGCMGRVIARKSPGVCQPWHISKIEPHSCELVGALSEHRNVTAKYVSHIMMAAVEEDINMSVKTLRTTAEDLIGFPVSRGKARRAKEDIFQRLYGTYEQAYDYAPKLLHQIATANRGSQVFMKHRAHPNNQYERILDRIFWAFPQTIQAFHHCRPVLSIDGTFLTGKYKGTLLVAIAADANNQLLPIAYALVESENKNSWFWFLSCLKVGVVKNRPGVCIVSDRNTGLLSALDSIKQSTDPSWGWPDLETRWCMRHLAANFYSKFKNKDWFKLFKRMCMQKTQAKMNAIWAAINRQIEHDSLPAREDQRGRSRPVINLSQWITGNCPELYKWALCEDTGARYGIMTSNMSEVYNGVLKGVRALPITALIQETWNRTLSYFADRVQVANAQVAMNKPWSEKIQLHLNEKAEKSRSHGCSQVDATRHKWQISVRSKFVHGHHRGSRKHAVTLGPTTCECTCQKPKLLAYPCSHVLRAAAEQNISIVPYISAYFNTENLFNTWSGEFWAWGMDMHYRDMLSTQLEKFVPDPTLLRTAKGRRRSRRYRNDMDHSQSGEPRRCRICRCPGHPRRECPYRNVNTT